MVLRFCLRYILDNRHPEIIWNFPEFQQNFVSNIDFCGEKEHI